MTRFISIDDLFAQEEVISEATSAEKPISDDDNIEINQKTFLPFSIKENKWYMPKLNLNDSTFYIQAENPKPFTDDLAYKTCLGNCCGIEGMKAACCQLNPDTLEHILGPVKEDWIKWFIRAVHSTNGIVMTRADVVVDFEEGKELGKTLFKNNPVFQDPKAYPFLRLQTLGPRFACKFLNPQTFKCGIYSMRPDFCKNYWCSFVKSNFLVRKPGTQNSFVKVR